MKALEKVAGFEMMLREAEVGPPEDKVIQERLIAEYYVLRTALVGFPFVTSTQNILIDV